MIHNLPVLKVKNTSGGSSELLSSFEISINKLRTAIPHKCCILRYK